MSIDTFGDIIDGQTGLFEELTEHQQNLQKSILNKNYRLTQRSIREMGRIAENIQHGEQAREQALAILMKENELSEELGIHSLLATLAAPLRTSIGEKIRAFKTAVYTARTFNEGIAAYSSSQIDVLEDVITELYPGGSAYTATGQRRSAEPAMVLDHSL